MSDLLVTPEWLNGRLGSEGVRIVDASWYLPAQNRDAKAEFLAGHIPGAVFFDIDAIADRTTNLPHMLPGEAAFAAAAGALGLSQDDTIVVYDGLGLFSAPRVWWTLRTFGARDVRVLDGGLPAWKQAGYALESGGARPASAVFRARFDPKAVADLAGVQATLEQRTAAVVDARSTERFRGEAPEPRPGLPSGHMAGARNLPWEKLVTGGKLVDTKAIHEQFEASGVDLSRPVVTSCGSGVSAAILAFALARIGKTDVSLYDGSWAEWASQADAEIVGGSA